MNILAVGDVVNESGLAFLRKKLRGLQRLVGADFTVVNGENAAGTGILPRQADEILDAGADVVTLGNHAFRRKEICPYLDDSPYILRPLNLAPQVPGRGWGEYDSPMGPVMVVNLIGRCGMDFGPDNPFLAVERLLKEHAPRFVLIDFHAEATSEKLAMAYLLDGRVSALWGTHTHVQTSDGAVFPKGTGYITDLGMTGPALSVLGVKAEQSIRMFMGDPYVPFSGAPGPAKLECAVFTLDDATGLCTEVRALRIEE
ncbi:MAG: YmdB family metallophosphoesterase [Oscillospiraceae bacterium]|nr:YmdB family metallophosphoesterase [Oscillospiraceae bacterium]